MCIRERQFKTAENTDTDTVHKTPQLQNTHRNVNSPRPNRPAAIDGGRFLFNCWKTEETSQRDANVQGTSCIFHFRNIDKDTGKTSCLRKESKGTKGCCENKTIKRVSVRFRGSQRMTLTVCIHVSHRRNGTATKERLKGNQRKAALFVHHRATLDRVYKRVSGCTRTPCIIELHRCSFPPTQYATSSQHKFISIVPLESYWFSILPYGVYWFYLSSFHSFCRATILY